MTIGLWLLGALLGVRHAFEPDHLAAIAAMVTGRGRSRTAVRLGVTWGLGHSAALLVVASLLAAGRARVYETIGGAFELAVGAMLIWLGAWRFLGALRSARTAATKPPARGTPFYVGVLHGLAGSGALTALAASQVFSVPGRLAYVTVFGLGSIVGMGALAGLGGRFLSRLASRPSVFAVLGAATGALTFVLGVTWLWRHSP
jgi:hypothetical protein